MARIAGIDIPREKRLEISLTYIFGIGLPTAQKLCADLGLDPNTKVSALTDDEVTQDPHLRRREPAHRGRPAPRRPAGHQAQDRDRVLPGHPPPPRPAGPRSAHAHQRPHPQGPQAHRRQQEEGCEEVTRWRSQSQPDGDRAAATARTSPPAWCTSRARSTTRSSRSPTPRATSSPGRRRVASGSRARASRRRSPPSSPPSGPAGRPMEHGLRRAEVQVKGPGSGRDTAVRSIQNTGIEVTSIKDVTPVPHNGCRQPKRRRG